MRTAYVDNNPVNLTDPYGLQLDAGIDLPVAPPSQICTNTSSGVDDMLAALKSGKGGIEVIGSGKSGIDAPRALMSTSKGGIAAPFAAAGTALSSETPQPAPYDKTDPLPGGRNGLRCRACTKRYRSILSDSAGRRGGPPR